MTERRRSARVPANILVQHELHPGELQVDYATDLSRSGLFVRTSRAATVGESFTVQFAPARDGRLVHAFCRVARVAPDGFGAAFLRLDGESAELLLRELPN